jgi:hypothetical protein
MIAIAWVASAVCTASLAADDASESVRLSECENELELVAIVYVAENPQRSMALVGAKRGSLVRVGSWLGERQILDIAPRTLVLGPVGDACFVRLQDRSTTKPPPRRRSRRKGRR